MFSQDLGFVHIPKDRTGRFEMRPLESVIYLGNLGVLLNLQASYIISVQLGPQTCLVLKHNESRLICHGEKNALGLLFSAKRCPACKVIWPDLSMFLDKNKDDVLLLRANVRKAPKLVRDFSIDGDSKMVIFRNGKKVRRRRISKGLVDFLA